MDYLEKDDLVTINKMTIESHGGVFIPPANFLNENSIDYLVDTVQSKMYGQEIYKEIYEKAAMYMFTVISNHIFQDGNKRTGLEASLLFLKLNDYSLREELVQIQFNKKKIPESGKSSNELLFNFTIEIASGKLSLVECQAWFKNNIQR